MSDEEIYMPPLPQVFVMKPCPHCGHRANEGIELTPGPVDGEMLGTCPNCHNECIIVGQIVTTFYLIEKEN